MNTIKVLKSIMLISLTASLSVSCSKTYPCEAVEYETENSSSAYAGIFKDLIITVFSSDKDAAVDELSDDFIENLTEQDKLMIGIGIPETKSANSFSCISDSLKSYLAPSLYCEDTQGLGYKLSCLFDGSYYNNLSPAIREQLSLELNTLSDCRDAMIDVLIEMYNEETVSTRMSAVDRMAWSDMAKQMSAEDRENVIQTTFLSTGSALGGGVGIVISIVSYLIGFNW